MIKLKYPLTDIGVRNIGKFKYIQMYIVLTKTVHLLKGEKNE